MAQGEPDEVAPGLVAHPDEEGEGQGRDPPLRGNRVEADDEGVGEVDEECSAGGLKDEAKVEHPDVHALLENGEGPGVAGANGTRKMWQNIQKRQQME